MRTDEQRETDAATLARVIAARRTIHDFAAAQPPRAAVLAALDGARWAPNHHRTEPWRFYLPGAAAVARIIELNSALVRAKSGEVAAANKRERWLAMPGWLVVTCQRSADPDREREDYAACCCAVQNFALQLWAAGIGTKWSTGKVTRDPQFFAAIGADGAHESCVGLIWFGYPAEVPAQTRRPLADVLREVD